MADLVALGKLDPSSLLHLLHFLTLVHPFSFLFFILEREGVDEMKWGIGRAEVQLLGNILFHADKWAMPDK